jgi:hypothetical protein
MINSRNLDLKNINVFDKIWTNCVFVFILVIEFTISMFMVKCGNNHLLSKIMGTAPITKNQHIVCWCLGLSVLLVNIVIKQIPIQPFRNFEQNLNLESCHKKDHNHV